MGYQGWILENGLQERRGVELCLRPPPAGGRAHLVGDSYILTNGMGRVTAVFLRGYRNGTGHRNGVHRQPQILTVYEWG